MNKIRKTTKKYQRKTIAKGVSFPPDLEKRIIKNASEAERSFGAEVLYGYKKYLKSLAASG